MAVRTKPQPAVTQEVCTFPLPEGSFYWDMSVSQLVANWHRIFPLAVQEVLLAGYTIEVAFAAVPYLNCTSNGHPADCRLPFTLLDDAGALVKLEQDSYALQEQLDYLAMLARNRITSQKRASKRKAALDSLEPWQREALDL